MFAPFYLKPGTYFKITDVPAPLTGGGDFLPLFVGLGRKELDVFKTMTRGNTPDGTDIISDNDEIIVLIHNLVDSNNIIYIQNVDFKLKRTINKWEIDWNVPQSIIGTATENFDIIANTNDTIKLNINGTSATITLTAGNGKTAANIASDINNVFANVASDDGSGHVKLTANKIVIEGGSALSTLGFIQGQIVESKEPNAGETYTLAYKRIKKSTEYKQSYFTRLEDVYADQGTKGLPTVIFEQITSSGVSASNPTGELLATFADTNATFITKGVIPGNYIKITDGSGKGQIRVIVEIISETSLKIAPVWDDIPNSTSTYKITDIGYYQTSNAAYFANLNGAQAFVISQVPDDIVDDNNWRGAIEKTKNAIDGIQGWCLVPLYSFDKNESLLSYIKNYLFDVNSTANNEERMALLGVKVNLKVQDIVGLLNAANDERIGIITNLYATDDNNNIYGAEYIAAAISGIVCNPNYDAGEPISGKSIQGFKMIYNNYNNYEERLIGQNGGILIEKQGVDYKIIHFLSTNSSDIIKVELKVVKQKDSIKKSLRNILQNALVNTRALDIAIARADSLVRMILNNKVDLTEIASYRNLSIAFDGNDPRQLNISFEFKPTFDINWVYVQFGAHI